MLSILNFMIKKKIHVCIKPGCMNMLFWTLDNVHKLYWLPIMSSPNCKLMDIMTYTKFKIIVLDILWKGNIYGYQVAYQKYEKWSLLNINQSIYEEWFKPNKDWCI